MSVIRLIASAAYVDQELSAEFGRIPPAFLPVGTSRLYEAQVSSFGGGPIFLTLPESFRLPTYDRDRLSKLDVAVLPIPDGLRLGESISYALNLIAAPAWPVRLLHGDTLVDDLPPADELDVVATSADADGYSWAAVEAEGDRIARVEVVDAGDDVPRGWSVACGYFAFASSALLTRALTRARGAFVEGLSFYAGERPLRVAPVRSWHDFGHVQTYFRSRRTVSTARAFNTVENLGHAVRKTSADRRKMRAEAQWFAALPPAAQVFSARLLGSGERDGTTFYDTAYEYAPTLSELYVFAPVGRPTWRRVLKSCREFLEVCARTRGPGDGNAALDELVRDKTAARLLHYARTTGFDIDRPTRFAGLPLPPLSRIAESVSAIVAEARVESAALMHGDFCFSNILYQSRTGRIVVLDPRGSTGREPSCFGDTRYDLAKLSHSIDGLYDHIMAGRYALRRDGERSFDLAFDLNLQNAWVQDAFSGFAVGEARAASIEVRAITVSLFLSMLPLHDDRPDRQAAFIANALRLFADMEAVPA